LYIRHINNDHIKYYGHNYTTWVNMSSDILREWIPNLSDCDITNYDNAISTSTCQPFIVPNPYDNYDLMSFYVPYTQLVTPCLWKTIYKDPKLCEIEIPKKKINSPLPSSVFKMPLGFGVEHGPRAYNIVDLLIYFHNNNIMLVNIGDSLSHQLDRAIIYECIRSYGKQVHVTPAYISKHMAHVQIIIKLTDQIKITFGHIRARECANANKLLSNYIKVVKFSSNHNYKQFVVVYNVGVHCHNAAEYEQALLQTFQYCEQAKFNMTFFYKQTSYQHFPTLTGEHAMDMVFDSTTSCTPHQYESISMYQEIEDRQIALAHERYIQSNESIRPIYVLPFRHTIELWDLHVNHARENLDCTHFVEYTPMLHQPLFYTLYRHFLNITNKSLA
jgi:hypothetical protein